MNGVYRIGGKDIEIISLHTYVHKQCEEYRWDAPPDFRIETVPADIDHERERSARGGKTEGILPRRTPDAYLEALAVYRRIAERMPEYDTILFHGSAIAVDGQAYLFTGKSGLGKSTHTRLWRELLGDRAIMVNDDKPLIRVSENGAVICGTPWDGKHHLSSNIVVPLKAICTLEQAKDNWIRPVSREEAFPVLIQQTYRPADPAVLAKTLSLIDRLSRTVRLYHLRCNMDISAAKLSYGTMKEGKR